MKTLIIFLLMTTVSFAKMSTLENNISDLCKENPEQCSQLPLTVENINTGNFSIKLNYTEVLRVTQDGKIFINGKESHDDHAIVKLLRESIIDMNKENSNDSKL